jgi:hypothetical protein
LRPHPSSFLFGATSASAVIPEARVPICKLRTGRNFVSRPALPEAKPATPSIESERTPNALFCRSFSTDCCTQRATALPTSVASAAVHAPQVAMPPSTPPPRGGKNRVPRVHDQAAALEQIPIPQPGEGEVLLRIEARSCAAKGFVSISILPGSYWEACGRSAVSAFVSCGQSVG